MTEDFELDPAGADHADNDAERAEKSVLLAQADSGADPAGSAPSTSAISPATPNLEVVNPDTDNKVRLDETVSLKDFQIDGDDLLLVQPDGSEIRIVGAAANLPTFIIGEIEIPQDVLITALNADGLDVAAGPENSVSVSTQVTDGSGGNFVDSSGTSIAGGGTPVLELLDDASFEDLQPTATPNLNDDAGTLTTDDGEGAGNPAVGNDAPVLTGDLAAELDEGATYTLSAADIGYTDADDGDAGVSFTISNLANGSLSVNGSAATTFTPAELAAGLVVFTHDGSETLAAGFDIVVEDG
ncbi:cadherin-like domain-containing protein, partial [Hoeflea sp.]|uniref:cadherin-like domain-containing protein n=1 Tax=Hoeflea sp. TaxID=1940281 RepID=UPI003A8E6D80